MARSLLFSPWPDWDLYSYQQSLTCQFCCHVKWKLPTLHSSYFFWSSSLLTKPNTRWPASQEECFVLAMTASHPRKLFTASPIKSYHPEGRKRRHHFQRTLWKCTNFRLQKAWREGLLPSVSHVLPTWGCLMMNFRNVQLGL